jgi:ketosteroid isomerase-like protein
MNRWAVIVISVMSVWAVVSPGGSEAADGHDHARHQKILAEAEIAKLPTTYAWAVDTKNIDLLMSVFSEDVVYDLSAYDFPSASGKEAVRKVFLSGILSNVRCSFISISNIQVEVTGDTATGGDYFVHAGYDPRGRPANTRSHTEGQHFYEFKKESGEWKISRMRGSPFFEKWETFDPKGLRHCREADGFASPRTDPAE